MKELYTIRKRTPKCLTPIYNRKEIKHSFNTQQELDAFNMQLTKWINIVNSNLPLEVTRPLILADSPIWLHNSSIPDEIKATIDMAIQSYLDTSKSTVTKIEYNNRRDFFTTLLPSLWKRYKLPNEVQNVTVKDLNLLAKALQELPNRRLNKYRNLTTDQLLTITAPTEERLAMETANKLIKRIRSLALFGAKTGLFTLPTTIQTIKVKQKDKGIRIPLTMEDYDILEKVLTPKPLLLLQIIKYSGIRPSEIPKVKLSIIDDIEVFDLSNSQEQLKTASAYRYIPIAEPLMPFKELISALTYPSIQAQ